MYIVYLYICVKVIKNPSPLLRRSVACQTHRAQRSKKIGWDFT